MPCFKRTAALGDRPQRLTFVKITSRPNADPIRHNLGPVRTGDVLHQFGNRRQRFGGGLRPGRRFAQCRRCGRLVAVKRIQRELHIHIGDLSGTDLRQIILPGQRHANACGTLHPGGGHSKALARLTQERVHRNAGRQGPKRRDLAGCCIGGLTQRSIGYHRCILFHKHDPGLSLSGLPQAPACNETVKDRISVKPIG